MSLLKKLLGYRYDVAFLANGKFQRFIGHLHSNAPRKLAILIARGIAARSKGVIFWVQ